MPYIYKYVNKETEQVEYVGIIKSDSNFPGRFYQHSTDPWYVPNKYQIYYAEVETQTDAEALEGHFIATYRSDRFYNIAKGKWGICSFAPLVKWTEFNFKRKNVKRAAGVTYTKVTYKKIQKYKAKLLNCSLEVERLNQTIQETLEEISDLCTLDNQQKDSVQSFLCGKTTQNSTDKTDRETLYRAYFNYCTGSNYSPLTRNGFYKALRDKGIGEIRDVNKRYFMGVTLGIGG